MWRKPTNGTGTTEHTKFTKLLRNASCISSCTFVFFVNFVVVVAVPLSLRVVPAIGRIIQAR